ncbi:LysM peptidoglycan-binding domain-containing protein [PVC group bacterium]|nr:LysM peptidoglycan-binding domain-containing protein [PVC group bacterium]
MSCALSSGSWREGQARVVLEAWVESGESLEAFARRHGVTLERLRSWQRRLVPEQDAEGPNPVGLFLPVKVVSKVDKAAARLATVDPANCRGPQPVQNSGLEVVLGGGRVVRIATGFDAETLARVVGTLEAVPC